MFVAPEAEPPVGTEGDLWVVSDSEGPTGGSAPSASLGHYAANFNYTDLVVALAQDVEHTFVAADLEPGDCSYVPAEDNAFVLPADGEIPVGPGSYLLWGETSADFDTAPDTDAFLTCRFLFHLSDGGAASSVTLLSGDIASLDNPSTSNGEFFAVDADPQYGNGAETSFSLPLKNRIVAVTGEGVTVSMRATVSTNGAAVPAVSLTSLGFAIRQIA